MVEVLLFLQLMLVRIVFVCSDKSVRWFGRKWFSVINNCLADLRVYHASMAQ